MSFNFGNYEAVIKTFYLEIFIRALAYLSEYRLVLVRVLSLPVVLYFFTKTPFFAYLGIYVPLFLSILGYLLYIIVIVMIHRILILGLSSVDAFSIRTWSNRETHFFLRTIGLTLIASIFFFFSDVHLIISILSLCIVALFYARLSLVFPGTSIDSNITFLNSWYLTKGYTFFMPLVLFTVPLVFYIPIYLLAYIPFSWILTTILSVIVWILEVAILSVAFKYILNEQNKPKTESTNEE